MIMPNTALCNTLFSHQPVLAIFVSSMAMLLLAHEFNIRSTSESVGGLKKKETNKPKQTNDNVQDNPKNNGLSYDLNSKS